MKEKWDVLNKQREETGEKMERGLLKDDQFHLIVNVWLKNKNNEYLISKRTGNKRWPNLWGCTIGSAIAGDNSIDTAIKEVYEELGILLDKSTGELVKTYVNYVGDAHNCGEFIDVWLFNVDINLKDIVFQQDETCDAMYASKEKIESMMNSNGFIPLSDLPYFSNDIK